MLFVFKLKLSNFILVRFYGETVCSTVWRLVSVNFIDYISPTVYLDGTTYLYLNKLYNQSIICAMLISVCSKIYQLGEVPNYWLFRFGMLSPSFIDMIAVKG